MVSYKLIAPVILLGLLYKATSDMDDTAKKRSFEYINCINTKSDKGLPPNIASKQCYERVNRKYKLPLSVYAVGVISLIGLLVLSYRSIGRKR